MYEYNCCAHVSKNSTNKVDDVNSALCIYTDKLKRIIQQSLDRKYPVLTDIKELLVGITDSAKKLQDSIQKFMIAPFEDITQGLSVNHPILNSTKIFELLLPHIQHIILSDKFEVTIWDLNIECQILYHKQLVKGKKEEKLRMHCLQNISLICRELL
jgi:hypothetical protein